MFWWKIGYDIIELVFRWCFVIGEIEDFVCVIFELLILLGFVNFCWFFGEKFLVDFLKFVIVMIICLFFLGID